MALTEHQKRARRQERTVADEIGGRTTPGSGNTFIRGNDVVNKALSIECKTTTADSYRLSLRVLKAAERHALLDGREMVLQLDIQERRYAVVDWAFFLQVMGAEV